MQHDPELYQNEGPFGPVPGIQVGQTWKTRQARTRYHETH